MTCKYGVRKRGVKITSCAPDGIATIEVGVRYTDVL